VAASAPHGKTGLSKPRNTPEQSAVLQLMSVVDINLRLKQCYDNQAVLPGNSTAPVNTLHGLIGAHH
jgi:hypothetical protein